MSNELIINATEQETRVALIEKGTVAELYIERTQDKGIVGNIYKGKVARVLPGMQAAFVDIGLEKAAFLYAGDVFLSEKTTDFPQHHLPGIEDFEDYHDVDVLAEEQSQQPSLETSTEPPPQGVPAERPSYQDNRRFRRSRNHQPPNIGELLQEGQEVFVQDNCPNDVGVIIRTASENKKPRLIKADLDYLLKIWREIEKDLVQAPSPYLLHEELNIVLRTLRDMFVDDIDR